MREYFGVGSKSTLLSQVQPRCLRLGALSSLPAGLADDIPGQEARWLTESLLTLLGLYLRLVKCLRVQTDPQVLLKIPMRVLRSGVQISGGFHQPGGSGGKERVRKSFSPGEGSVPVFRNTERRLFVLEQKQSIQAR